MFSLLDPRNSFLVGSQETVLMAVSEQNHILLSLSLKNKSYQGETPVTISEEQQVAAKLWEFHPPGSKALMGDSQTDMAQMALTPQCLLLLPSIYMFSAAIFLLYLAWSE